jgi:putative aldouronate transport system substrate-binding protein
MWSSPGWERIMLINARFASDPAALQDILKVLDYWYDPANQDFLQYGIEGVHHTVDANGVKVTTEQGQADIGWIRAWGPRGINTIPMGNYNTPEHLAYIEEFIDAHQDIVVGSATWGLWPELGMDNPEAALNELAATTFDAIVRGAEPLEAFDAFVENWYAQGGRELTDAYTAAYQQMQQQ